MYSGNGVVCFLSSFFDVVIKFVVDANCHVAFSWHNPLPPTHRTLPYFHNIKFYCYFSNVLFAAIIKKTKLSSKINLKKILKTYIMKVPYTTE
jgi:hypothetical protein